MSATITTLYVPFASPVVELSINDGNSITTSYPATFDKAIVTLQSLNISNIEYDEIVDTRLLHPLDV